MNKGLFVVRNLKRKPVILFSGSLLLLVFAALLFQFNFNYANSFLKFHDKIHYSPSNANNQGFYGKANALLKKALENKKTKKYDIGRLNDMYVQLTFYYPPDNDDHLVSTDDIRLIDFVPGPGEESFYYNSYLSNLIALQKKDLTTRYFNIRFDRDRRTIRSITVDSTLYNLSLQNTNWKGDINFEDPFANIDTNVRYLIFNHKFIPLFSSTLDSNSFRNSNNYGLLVYPFKHEKYTAGDFEDFYHAVNAPDPQRRLAYRFSYSPDPADSSKIEYSVRFLNTGKEILIQPNAIDMKLFGGGHGVVTNRGDAILHIAATAGESKLVLKLRGYDKKDTIYIVNKSPFSVASRLQDDGITQERIHLDTSYLDLFASQQLNQLENGITQNDHVAGVNLSTNLLLSKYLETRIREQVKILRHTKIARPDDEFEMSMCLMDISTGEIIAAPYYSNTFHQTNDDPLAYKRNFNLVRHNIGSTFKPLITLAASLKYKSLAGFTLLPAQTQYLPNSSFSEILGYKTLHYGFLSDKITPNYQAFWPSSGIDRTHFLAMSHDNYPIAMTLLALTEKEDAPAYNKLFSANLDNAKVNDLYGLNGPSSRRITFHSQSNRTVLKEIASSSYIHLLSNLYDVEANVIDSTFNVVTYDQHILDGLNIARPAFFQLYPDLADLGTEYFGNVKSDDSDFKNLELFVLGEGNNVWSNVKLAEAYSRMLSKRRVNATLLKSHNLVPEYLFKDPNRLFQFGSSNFSFDISQADMEASWAGFMDDWRKAVKMNINKPLLKPAYDNFKAEVPDFDQYYFYCKTGTPQADNDLPNDKVFKKGKQKIWLNEGVFAFGITNRDPKFPKGVAGVVYIKHLSLNETRTVNSATAREFLTPEIFKEIMFYNKKRFNN